MWERCCTHEDAGIGARQAGQEWQLQWHISKQQGWFEKLLWKTQGEQPVWKGKRKKGEKSLRNSEMQLKLLFSFSPVVKENCGKKYLNSLWQQGSKWLLLPVTEESSAAPCEPEGFTSSLDLGTLCGAKIPLFSLYSACLLSHGPDLKAPDHMGVFSLVPQGGWQEDPLGVGLSHHPLLPSAPLFPALPNKPAVHKYVKIFPSHSQPCWRETCCG